MPKTQAEPKKIPEKASEVKVVIEETKETIDSKPV
jgi:hypothetical protein